MKESWSLLADILSCCLGLATLLQGWQSVSKNAQGKALSAADITLLTTLPALTGAVLWIVYICDFPDKLTS